MGQAARMCSPGTKETEPRNWDSLFLAARCRRQAAGMPAREDSRDCRRQAADNQGKIPG